MKSLEEYISAIQNITETEGRAIWLKADLLLEAREVYQGYGFTNAMAEALGCSARYIQELIKVAKTFPEEERLFICRFDIQSMRRAEKLAIGYARQTMKCLPKAT